MALGHRKRLATPRKHERIAYITTAIAVCFMGLSVYGFWIRDFWLAFATWHGATVAKLCLFGRMVLLRYVMADNLMEVNADAIAFGEGAGPDIRCRFSGSGCLIAPGRSVTGVLADA